MGLCSRLRHPRPNIWPVMWGEAGRHRKAIAAATSSGSGMRFIGVVIDLHTGCANAADEVESGEYHNSCLRAHDPDVSQDYFRPCLGFALS
jgi:hypothetical protein